jgi:hypothetical protein
MNFLNFDFYSVLTFCKVPTLAKDTYKWGPGLAKAMLAKFSTLSFLTVSLSSHYQPHRRGRFKACQEERRGRYDTQPTTNLNELSHAYRGGQKHRRRVRRCSTG